ncbi:MAG: DUF5677 domain-containing protein [Deltaproteobacteria bacterium]|nr:DUF5677 domain-containing protein [Deltaproteobacteria bacterium]
MEDIEKSIDKKDLEFLMEIIQNLVENGTDTEKLNKLVESGDFFKIVLDSIKENWPVDALESIKRKSKENLPFERIEKSDFEARLNQLWSEPFDLFETMIHISLEIGNEFNEEFRPEAAKQKDYVFEALIKLHGRACQIAQEILSLMQSGYPDGANARWRTLHEIAVTCLIIKKYGQETAERYLLFNEIESYNSIKAYITNPELYRAHQKFLQNSLPSEHEMKIIESNMEKLCKRFTPRYATPLGWAICNFPDLNSKETLRFSRLEKDANLDHLRPYYLMANIAVHSGPKGIYFHLTTPIKDVIPAGPSNMGMANPGQLAAISLLHVNTALLLTKPSIRRLADLGMMQLLVEEIKKSFIRVHEDTMNKAQILSGKENL